MAVAGRKTETKLSAIGTSLNISHNCGPCETDKDHIEAFGYCVDCEDYLCNVCFKSHGKNKASRHHKLLTYDEISTENVSQLKTSTCTEICTVHKKEYVKFFCPEHKVLGCNDCMTLGHRTCVIQYIPDKCKGISDSLEYKTTVSKLAQELEEINSHIVKVNVKDGIAESMHAQCIKELNNFQAQLNERIDQLRIQIQNDADNIKSKNKEDNQKVVNALHEKKSRLEEAEFDINKHKTANQEGQLFISIKRAQSVLREKEKNVGHMSVTNENMLYKFEPSHRLRSILAEPDIFGKLNPQNPESVETLEPVTNGVVVLNVPEDLTRDAVKMYFENVGQSQGGETETVDVHADQKYCLVSFKDQKVVQRVCEKRDRTISGHNVTIHMCNEFLGLPYSFTLEDHDPNVLKYLKNKESKRTQIDKELSNNNAKILWDEIPLRMQLLFRNEDKCRCNRLRAWKEETKRVIKTFADAISIKVVAFSEAVWGNVVKALETVVVSNPDKIAICVDKVVHQVYISCDDGHTEADIDIILEILTPFECKTEN
ncbi:transcription intermediary factor 1-alpha-like [Mercenaria mercenaria]|uniref:transcription intermediary factor 1-alpha-like n=1 Tax=Mercenaria mercenaria TaxID=6596 RepID=UPI00234E8285|nr:transcription intermediary factor 1-alpha-like [Mercenaria mercenaria]